MVSPGRIRHLIEKIQIDSKTRSLPLIDIDFFVRDKVRYFVRYDVRRRTFIAFEMSPVGMPSKLGDYLISIIPPEVKAQCIAASLGAPPSNQKST